MTKLFVIILLCLQTKSTMETIYNFSPQTNLKDWNVVNDGVMGGVSKSKLVITDEGYGQFSGQVSLANNGGFASLQHNKKIVLAENKQVIVLRIKGDKKSYEFRLKGNSSQYESYVQKFDTNGEWQTIKLLLNNFYPQFRGRKLNLPNFNFDQITQMSFLIANKQEEDFSLLIDWIGLE